ncbi:hypothetical protein HNY73_004184 [Argiope bruennichi]|uniref:Uncharacterized protein n=1 Tax=Argiope bruennichi TaxID=94029 RepID=A0A8T0FSX1_ARGBR|nr:hypothetical protein HNY73_004184 [Argiope bruennichi]
MLGNRTEVCETGADRRDYQRNRELPPPRMRFVSGNESHQFSMIGNKISKPPLLYEEVLNSVYICKAF